MATVLRERTRRPVAADPKRRPRNGRRRVRPNYLAGIGGFVWLGVIIIPIYYIVITSIGRQSDFYTGNPLLPSSNPTLDSYRAVLDNDFLLYLGNSVVVTVASVVVTVGVSLMAAYAIVRSRARMVRLTFSLFLLGLAIPLQATIIPLYYMIGQAHLYDTLLALILPSIAFAIPITVLILVNFIRDIPAELFESMRVDGASHWRLFISLVVPLSRPAITTVTLYNALNVWNGFLFPLVLTQSADKRVLPLSLWTFQGQFSINVPAILAAVVLSTLPIFVLYVLGRRQLVAGLTAGFGK
ncbi:carbohydrate ABC transporter permease [Sinomonas terrae]|uniref:Carbohydrate ABC transporter permease n=1 Tax=Sinomonas terrae TaxID=2908838 RepID=A0ABS9U6Q7_9MICC|nr:carbohydrate ABC transporter permease [Sinomonas terrae]MCH6472383.1 carbohydrate ABC transporter permease [Sinomonas terrae]